MFDPLCFIIKKFFIMTNYLKQYIINVENKQAILQLIGNKGWKEHDVSDDIHNDTKHKLSMNFIGTDEEYKVLIEKIYENHE